LIGQYFLEELQTMKKALFINLMLILMLPLFILGCQQEEPAPSTTAPPSKTQEPVITNKPAVTTTTPSVVTQVPGATNQPPSTTAPSVVKPEDVIMDITSDEFSSQKNIVKDMEIVQPGSLTVSLGSNSTTGFQWTESAAVSDPAVIKQVSHIYVAPPTSGDPPLVGAGGKEVWVFNSLKTGTTTISMSYGRPWEGGEKGVWTLTLNVKVK
jgi:inhibitor of cysteine peptidase